MKAAARREALSGEPEAGPADPDSSRTEAGAARRFPPSAIPIHPVISFASFRGARFPVASILDNGDSRLVTSGRIAIAMALRECNAQSGDEVLLPGYCCSSMVDPIHFCGLVPVFYEIDSELSIDLSSLKSRISNRTRAILAVHYFGFQQQLAAVRSLCDERGLVLIEDCAHAFFGRWSQGGPGATGDYAIASPTKFFPVYDGGCLVSSRHSLDNTPLQASGWKFPIKATLNALERSVKYNRLRPLGWVLRPFIAAKDWLWSSIKSRRAEQPASIGPPSADGGFEFDNQWMNVAMSAPSAFLMRSVSASRIVTRRRSNYRRLAAAFAGIDGVRVVFPELPQGVVPYVFPVFVHEAARVFPYLKKQGVPIYRWEEVYDEDLPVSCQYTTHIFQLPCHQELSDSDLHWLIERVCEAVAVP